MKRRCKILRERALKAGLDSPEASMWRIHSRSCPDCQTEHFLLEALQRQAKAQRQHLGRAEVTELLETARKHHGRRHRPHLMRTWLWRAALLALLLGVTWHLSRSGRVRQVAESTPVQILAQVADDACGNYGIPLFSACSEHKRVLDQMATSSASTTAPQPVIMPEFFFRDRLLNIREEIESRRQDILERFERDFGDWDRDDAWEMVLPSNVAIV